MMLVTQRFPIPATLFAKRGAWLRGRRGLFLLTANTEDNNRLAWFLVVICGWTWLPGEGIIINCLSGGQTTMTITTIVIRVKRFPIPLCPFCYDYL